MHPDATGLKLLDRHGVRRAQGVPTVSVLVGALADAVALWSAWLASEGRPAVTSSATRRRDMAHDWLSSDGYARRFVDALVASFARSLGLSIDELRARLRGKAEPERARFLPHLADAVGCPPEMTRLAVEVDEGADPGPLTDALVDGLPAAARFLPLPPLLVVGPSPAVDALEAIVAIAEAVPGADVGIAVGPDEGCVRQGLPPRILALMAEGLVDVSRPGAPSSGSMPVAHARSDAERRLHERLQARGRTRDLFRLNAMIGDPIDPVPLEADLCCEELRLVVEVDGYHHFRGPEDFRRDRRKDVRLQRLGYLVLRVLADDVVGEIDYVLQQIDAAVDLRARSR